MSSSKKSQRYLATISRAFIFNKVVEYLQNSGYKIIKTNSVFYTITIEKTKGLNPEFLIQTVYVVRIKLVD